MTKPQYRTRQHRLIVEEYRALVDSGQGWCTEDICLEERDGRTRWIRPGSPMDAAHTDDGRGYKGPAHRRCNRADGARRGNAQRVSNRRRRVL